MANDAPVLFDATRLIWRRWARREPTGVDRVCLAYLEHFGPRAQAVINHRRFRAILDSRASAVLFEMLLNPPRRFRTSFVQAAAFYGASSGCSGRGRVYLNVGHTGLDSPGFRAWLRRADVAPVYFVHDLIPISHPQFCRTGESARHRNRMRTVLATAAGVVANSQATLDELDAFARAERLPDVPALAAWLGTPPLGSPSPAADSGDPAAFVTVGTIEARKNHRLLLDIWTKLIERLGPDAPRLVIIGQRGWEAEDVFARLDSDERLRGHVVEINDATDEQMMRHLSGARALLFPSHAEGYGLPLVEALGLKVPVIASDLQAFREIGQRVPLLLRPGDAAAWESAILDFAQPQSAARAAQLKRMEQFRLPTWEDHLRSVEDWLLTIC